MNKANILSLVITLLELVDVPLSFEDGKRLFKSLSELDVIILLVLTFVEVFINISCKGSMTGFKGTVAELVPFVDDEAVETTTVGSSNHTFR